MRMEPSHRAGLIIAGSIILAISFIMPWYRLIYNPPANISSTFVNGIQMQPFNMPIAGFDIMQFYPIYRESINAIFGAIGLLFLIGLFSFWGTNIVVRLIQRSLHLVPLFVFIGTLYTHVNSGFELAYILNNVIVLHISKIAAEKLLYPYLTINFDLGFWVLAIGVVLSGFAVWSREGEEGDIAPSGFGCLLAIVAVGLFLWWFGRGYM